MTRELIEKQAEIYSEVPCIYYVVSDSGGAGIFVIEGHYATLEQAKKEATDYEYRYGGQVFVAEDYFIPRAAASR